MWPVAAGAHHEAVTDQPCLVCERTPRVLLVMQHPAMLRLTRLLLERECGCWVATEVQAGPALAAALDRLAPDLLVIDVAGLRAGPSSLASMPRDRVIVIGPEPDQAYRDVAIALGAGAWLSRDEVADKLDDELRRLLGCRHDACPPRNTPARA